MKETRQERKLFNKNRTRKRTVVLSVAAVVVIAAIGIGLWYFGIFDKAAASTGITLSQYEQIERDMPYQEVIDILGKGELDTEEGTAGDPSHTAVYKWQGTTADARAVVVFYGGRVASSTQIGLTD